MDGYIEKVPGKKYTEIGCAHIKEWGIQGDTKVFEISHGITLFLCHICYASMQERILNDLTTIHLRMK